MTLSDLFPPDRVFRLKAPDKGAALAELARRAAMATGLAAADMSAALATREKLGSTGVGAGIAVPHARVAGLTAPVAFLVRLDRALDWGAIDGKPVDLLFLLLSPAHADAEHLAALATGTRRLRDAAAAAALRASRDTVTLRAVLVGP